MGDELMQLVEFGERSELRVVWERARKVVAGLRAATEVAPGAGPSGKGVGEVKPAA